mgnify:FL=1
MTTAARTRCVHCRTSYIFHPSFYGGDEVNYPYYPYNHQHYCEDCYKVVVKALAEVPVKYEKRFVPSDKYTREEIVEHQEERCATGLQMRRIMVGYIDMTGKTRHHQVCEMMPDGEWYLAEWWSHTPDDVQVRVEKWRETKSRPALNTSSVASQPSA